MSLQRSAGNRAVAALMTKPGRAGPIVVQRDLEEELKHSFGDEVPYDKIAGGLHDLVVGGKVGAKGVVGGGSATTATKKEPLTEEERDKAEAEEAKAARETEAKQARMQGYKDRAALLKRGQDVTGKTDEEVTKLKDGEAAKMVADLKAKDTEATKAEADAKKKAEDHKKNLEFIAAHKNGQAAALTDEEKEAEQVERLKSKDAAAKKKRQEEADAQETLAKMKAPGGLAKIAGRRKL